MTDVVQINTLDEELEWEEWKGVCNHLKLTVYMLRRTSLSGSTR